MSIVPVESDRFTMMEKVAEASWRLPNPTAIAKELGIQRKVVIELLDDYKTALASDQEARDMARDHLNMMVKHYDSLIAKFYDLIEEIDSLSFSHQVAAQKNSALKAIAELDAKRVDALQKAGLLDSAELGDELAKWEEEKDMMLSVLRDLCNVCQPKVANRIAKLRGNDVDTIEVEVLSDSDF